MLVKRTDGRPPGYDRENDYDVVFRGRKVGRIWKYDYTGKVSGEMARWLWHWDWRDVEGRKDAEGHCAEPRSRDDGLSFSLGRARVQRHNQMKRCQWKITCSLARALSRRPRMTS